MFIRRKEFEALEIKCRDLQLDLNDMKLELTKPQKKNFKIKLYDEALQHDVRANTFYREGANTYHFYDETHTLITAFTNVEWIKAND